MSFVEYITFLWNLLSFVEYVVKCSGTCGSSSGTQETALKEEDLPCRQLTLLNRLQHPHLLSLKRPQLTASSSPPITAASLSHCSVLVSLQRPHVLSLKRPKLLSLRRLRPLSLKHPSLLSLQRPRVTVVFSSHFSVLSSCH